MPQGIKSVELQESVYLGGAAKFAKNGSPFGSADTGESERMYIFRVSLPGVCEPQCNLKFDVHGDGKVEIEGVIQNSKFLKDHIKKRKYRPIAQELSPPGSFGVSFSLPGRVDPRLMSPSFRNPGILEVIAIKHDITSRQRNDFTIPVRQTVLF